MNRTINTQPTVEVDKLSVAFDGKVVLSEVGLKLFGGTITALVGPNGGGKSTLFKAIMDFVTPIHGSVEITGLTARLAQKQNKVAYVPQSEENDWNFPINVYETVMMGRYAYMGFLRSPSENDHKVVRESLRRVNLMDFDQRQIGALSGGQKKRVFLARALAQGGQIILLDEPFTGVDAKTETAIVELLRQLRKAGQTILVSTHDLAAVKRFCDQVIMLDRKLIAHGRVGEVFTKKNITKTFGGMLLNLDLS